jgi:tetratricopeptide (TPR) repeat protein
VRLTNFGCAIGMIPHDPDLPRQTAALALQAAIETEDAPMMAEMLLLHARRVETVESPLDALRAGNPQRALKLAERILREQDYQIGTLWLLLLAWVSSMGENGAEFAVQCLNRIRDWWHANRPQPLSDDWAPVVVEILLQFPCAQATEMAIILQDEAKADLVRGLLESGLCPLDERVEQALAAAERIENAYWRSEAYRAVALALAQAGQVEQALAAAERIENGLTGVRWRIVRWRWRWRRRGRQSRRRKHLRRHWKSQGKSAALARGTMLSGKLLAHQQKWVLGRWRSSWSCTNCLWDGGRNCPQL